MSRRIRTIKPEILDDDKTAGLSHVAWRLFVSGLTLSDDHGNLRAGVTYLAGQVFHSCPHTDSDAIRTAVDELIEAGLWQVYTVRGQTYAHIRGWSKHQRIDNAGKPRVPPPGEADGTRPISAPCEEKAFAANRRESPRVAASRRGSRLDQDQEGDQEGTKTQSESAGAGAPAPARAFDKSPDTSPSGRVVAEVVSTEAPPSRLPPVPVEVAPSVSATVPPSSHTTGPLAASAAEDDDQPPPAQRCPSTPRPGPVAAVAPAAPVEAAPAVAPAPPVAAPSSPVAASPSGQTALLPDLAPVPVPAEDAPPVAIPRVADLDERTPANRVLRVWGATCYRAHQQPLATEARRRVVRDRLRVFSEADLIRAIAGAMADPYVNGQSERAPSGGQRDIAWLFAKVERVEGFLRAATPPPAPPPSPRLAPRMPPPLKPGQVRPLISVEDYERNAFAPVLPRRMSPADLAAFDQGGAHVG